MEKSEEYKVNNDYGESSAMNNWTTRKAVLACYLTLKSILKVLFSIEAKLDS